MAIKKSSMMKFPLVVIETAFTIILVLCIDIEMLSIIYIYDKSTSEMFFYFEHLLNEKSKGVNSCVKKRNKNCGSKVVGYKTFSLSEYLWNNCHTTVLTRMRMISPNTSITSSLNSIPYKTTQRNEWLSSYDLHTITLF